MKLIDLTCSKCGATLQVNSDLKKCMCQYCGNEMLIDDEVVHIQIGNGSNFGYQQEMGRQKFKEQLGVVDNQISQLKTKINNYEAKQGLHILMIIIDVLVLVLANFIALEVK